MFIFKGYTPLMAAAQGGNLDIVNLFLNKGADVRAKDDDGKFLILCFIGYRQFLSYHFMKIYLQLKEKIYLVIK